MAKELILAKYGEMALKGLNRGTFEDILMKNLRRRLKKFGVFKLTRAQSTIYMEPLSEDIDLDEVLERNIDKLKKRYPEGFSAEKSQHRQAGDI